MKEKLTLSIEKETKKRAKKHAKAVGRSISDMVEEYLETISRTGDNEFTPEPGSVTESLAGSMPLPDRFKNKDYKTIKSEILSEKYYGKKTAD